MIKNGAFNSIFIGVTFLIPFLVCSKPSLQDSATLFSSHFKKIKDSLVIRTQDPLGGPTLKLKALTQEVIRRNPDLEAARSRIRAAAAVVPRVQALDDPQFTFRSINHPFGRKREFTKERRYKFSQKIPLPSKLHTKGKIAEHILEFVHSEEVTTHIELILQAKRLYFLLHLNRVARDINKQNRDILTRLMQGALAVYKVGRARQTDALKAHIELQILDDELLSLESERLTLIAMLNALLDRPQKALLGQPKVTFYPDIELHYDQLESIAMRVRPELHGLQAQVDEHYSRAKLARLDYFPDFTFEFMAQSRPERNKRAWGINVGINMPVWIGQKQRYEVIEAEEHATANESALQGLRAIIRGRIKELLAQIKAAEERIDLYEKGLLTKTATTLASNQAHYLVGKGDFLTVLDTRRQLQDFELDYERVRIEREILLAELERAIGMPLAKIPRIPLISLKNLKLMPARKKEKS